MKRWRTTVLSLVPFLAVMGFVVGCAVTPLVPEIIHRAPSADSPSIVILKSGDNDFIRRPAESFVESIEGHISVFTLSDRDRAGALVKALEKSPPDLIFALGSRAARIAVNHFPNTPIIFAMVMNYQRHGFHNRPNIAGIAVELAPAMEFLQYRIVLPSLKRVVAFHGKSVVPTFAQAAANELKMIGVELILIAVESMESLEAEVDKVLWQADAVWFISDPVVGNRKAFNFLRDSAAKLDKPLVASISDQFADEGALVAVSVDVDAVGSQAASMARQILYDDLPIKEIGVRSPMASRLTLNLKTAEEISLNIPSGIIPHINRLIRAE